jgi:exopolyphosphatase/guanosine-5'-triphosphate,3'-diphosphate pyrophosphatase
VRVGIVDVGANTLRLLVASTEEGRTVPVREDRVQLGLGEEIERAGRIGDKKLDEAAEVARRHVRRARKLGCLMVDVLVTSPGRQAANGEELVKRLAIATGVPTRVLTSTEEGELAWRGALAAADELAGIVAVCDVGGGSAQIAVGAPSDRPAWAQSADIGSLRLTRRAFGEDPPRADELAYAEEIVAEEFEEIVPPRPDAAIAVGGTARALRRVVGNELAEAELRTALRRLSKRSSRKLAKEYGVDDARARTLTAGAVIFLEVQSRLGVPLRVGRGGLREGAALALLARAHAAARTA